MTKVNISNWHCIFHSDRPWSPAALLPAPNQEVRFVLLLLLHSCTDRFLPFSDSPCSSQDLREFSSLLSISSLSHLKNPCSNLNSVPPHFPARSPVNWGFSYFSPATLGPISVPVLCLLSSLATFLVPHI